MAEEKAIYSISRAEQAAKAVEQTRVANKSWVERRKELSQKALNQSNSTNKPWCRETYRLPREQAREQAKAFFHRYPKAAYWSEIENWRVLENNMIEFTLRRLPSAD